MQHNLEIAQFLDCAEHIPVHQHTYAHVHAHMRRKRLRKQGHYRDHSFVPGGEFALDSIRDHSISDHDEELSEECMGG